MVTVKVLGGIFGGGMPAESRLPGYRFVYDPDCSEYDWLVVYDEMPKAIEELRCLRERTILCTWEPTSIKSYSKAYTRQFGYLLTNRPPEAEKHPNYRLGRGYFVWFVHHFPLRLGAAAERKTKLLSAVCSAKQMKHTKHHSRFRLVETLAREIPGMDWFGKGLRPLDRKEDALDSYRYHVAVENHIGVHHWTEKFADAILCECLPFYAGDPALAEIFPRESFIPIPIDNPAEAVRIVRESIANDEYSKRREAILEAKRLILTRYNFWSQVVAVIESAAVSQPTAGTPGSSTFLYARKVLRRHDPLAALEDGWGHLKRYLRII